MAVRNFWIDVNIDGRETTLSGGPARKDGGMTVDIRQRNNGAGKTGDAPIRIRCYEYNNQLISEIKLNGKVIAEYKTER